MGTHRAGAGLRTWGYKANPPIFKIMNIGVGALTIDRVHPAVTFYLQGALPSTAFVLNQYEVCTATCIAVNTYICETT